MLRVTRIKSSQSNIYGRCYVEIEVGEDLRGKLEEPVSEIRALLEKSGVFMINMVSSPGAGKTTLIERLAEAMDNPSELAVIEGDMETELDAARVREKGVFVKQINTKSTCHIQPRRLLDVMREMDLSPFRLLIVENVGNLVCPAEVDLGEDVRMVLLSVTEGEEKPLKYPFVFKTSQILVITKVDLLPYVDFDVSKVEGFARSVNPGIEIFRISSRTGEGMDALKERILSLTGKRRA